MRRSMIAVLSAMALTLAACGGDDDDAAGGDSCEDLADEGIALIEDALSEAADLDLEEIAAAGGEEPEFVTELQTKGEELEARQDELGCTEEEMDALMCDRIGDIEADGFFAEALTEELAGDC